MTSTTARRRPTIDDVAAEAGVSRGTVSRVLNGGHWVSPEALAAVNAAIEKTAYRVNPHARGLATNRSNSVAFLLTEEHERLFEDPNFSILMRGAAHALAAYDISLVLIMAGTTDERRRAREFISAGHVDGVLLISSHPSTDTLISDLHRSGMPIIACGMPLGVKAKIGYVQVDDVDGARTMVAHLKSIGRRRIATITGAMDTSGGVGRLEGYRLELENRFDEKLVAEGDYSRVSGLKAMERLLEVEPAIDAVFAANDQMAAAAVEVITARGLRVPEDIAVGGFDDSAVATSTTPAITTMRQPFGQISEEMVRILVREIREENSTAAITLECELIVRESTIGR